MTPSLAPDRDMSRRFIDALTGDKQTAVTWQYFPDNKNQLSSNKRKLAGHPHGEYRTHYRSLEKKQSEGCGIFIMVNAGDGKGRKAENVVAVRTLFLDLDGSPMEQAVNLLKPNIIVESSPGRYHIYWKVSDCPLDRFNGLQREIAIKFNGDKSCVDLCRVMRVPGFWHLKGEPVMTRILEVNTEPTYKVDEVIARLGLVEGAETPVQQTSSTTSAKLQQTSSIAVADQKQSFSTDVIFPKTGEDIDLKRWAACHPDFDLLAALNQNAPQVLRGSLHNGKQHIQCPFESEHTEQATDHATFAANKGNGYASWEIHCMHSHCAGRDRLHFLSAMFEKEWLPHDLLTDSRTPESVAERKRPPKIYIPHVDLATDMAWSALKPDELRIALHLYLLSCHENSGKLPDDDWMLARKLGFDEEEIWKNYRKTLERVGWLKGDGTCLWNSIILREVEAASKAYNGKIAGGKMRHNKDTPSLDAA